MTIECSIGFEDNPSRCYYSGQSLRALVHLTVTEPKKVRGVFIQISGTGSVRWSKQAGRTRKTYKGEEDYLDVRKYLLGGPNDNIRLEPRAYTYTFKCLLPKVLPSSFESNFGNIRYKLSVVLDIPMWMNKEFEMPFIVIQPIDLNAYPELRDPVVSGISKKFIPYCLFFCYESGPLDIMGHMSAGAYVPGQTINILINVDNKSDQPISEFIVRIVQKNTHGYVMSSKQKIEYITVKEEKTRGCDSYKKDDIQMEIVVPSIKPTNNMPGRIISVEYFIWIIGKVRCFHFNPVVKIPIVIGSNAFQIQADSESIVPTPIAPNDVELPQNENPLPSQVPSSANNSKLSNEAKTVIKRIPITKTPTINYERLDEE